MDMLEGVFHCWVPLLLRLLVFVVIALGLQRFFMVLPCFAYSPWLSVAIGPRKGKSYIYVADAWFETFLDGAHIDHGKPIPLQGFKRKYL